MSKIKITIPWLIAAIAVIAAISIFMLTSAQTASAANTADSAAVTSVNVTNTIDASGYIKAQSYANLVWKTGGTVESITVRVGDQVKAGDVLMRLQTASAAANVISAQADLINAQKQLDALQNPDGETIAGAQKKLAGAYASWDKARSDLSSALSGKSASGDSNKYDDMISAQTDLSDALDAFPLTANPDSQWYYWAERMDSLDRSRDYDYAALAAALSDNVSSDDAALVVDIVDAQMKYEAAVQDFAESITDYSAAVTVNNAVATYQQSVEALMSASQDAYETLIAPNPKDLAAAQAKVDSAKASVDSLTIIAPFDGEVLAIEQISGDVVSTGTAAISLANRANLYIVTEVDEADIAQVAIGNPATITLDAMPGATLNGTVTFINPVGETISGLIKYSVRVELTPVEETVLLGATADVTIQVSDTQAALAVPASAVRSDTVGEYVTIIESDGSLRRVDVQSAQSIGSLVVVSGDLLESDRVQSSYQNGVQAPNPLGGK